MKTHPSPHCMMPMKKRKPPLDRKLMCMLNINNCNKFVNIIASTVQEFHTGDLLKVTCRLTDLAWAGLVGTSIYKEIIQMIKTTKCSRGRIENSCCRNI
jgi:hypothetical protein